MPALRRIRLTVPDELVGRLDRLCAQLGCPRSLLMRAILDGCAGLAEVERIDDRRQRRLPAMQEARGPVAVVTFEPARVVITIRRGGREYRLVRTLF